jgi:pimeloyl-ACP methyl ester carboxylesterase
MCSRLVHCGFHSDRKLNVPTNHEPPVSRPRSQVFIADANFKAVITTPSWGSKPSWTLVATKDRIINPDLERWYAARASSHEVEVSGASHSVHVSRPKEVAALIEDAASQAR